MPRAQVSRGSLALFTLDKDFETDDCNSTFINLYDGDTTNGALIKKICKMDTTKVVESSTNQMTVQFVTSKVHDGFIGKFVTSLFFVIFSISSSETFPLDVLLRTFEK